MFGTSAADSHASARSVHADFARRATATRPLLERYDEIHVATHPTPRARVASGVARDGARYHDGTKHHFTRSLNRSDTSTGRRSRAFRGFADTPVFPLHPAPSVAADGDARNRTTFDQACERELAAAPLSAPALGDMLRHALGLSAWKRFGSSRWSSG